MLSILIAAALAQNPAIRPAVNLSPDLQPQVVDKVWDLYRQTLEEQGVKAPARPPDPAIALVAQMRAAAAELNFNKMLALAEQAQAQQTAHPELVTDVKAFVDLRVLRVMALLGLKQKNGVPAAWREVRLVAPDYAPSLENYPPSVINSFQAWKRENPKDAQARVTLTSVPSLAEVFIDGVSRGTTPLVLNELPVGRHLLHARLAGYAETGRWLEVKPEGTALEIPLAADEVATRGTALDEALAKAASETPQKAAAWAEALGGPGFLLVLRRERDELLLAGARITPAGTSVRRVLTVPVTLTGAPEKLQLLVRELLTGEGAAFIGTPPSPLVDFEKAWSGLRAPVAPVAVIAPTVTAVTEPPLYKRPVFWVLTAVGVAVVAGGVTTAVVLTQPQPKPGLGVTLEFPQ